MLRVGKPSEPTNVYIDRVSVLPEILITFRWSAPERTGGFPITSYNIEVLAADETTIQRTTIQQSKNCVVTEFKQAGLEVGKEYIFRVSASNERGTGEYAELKKSIGNFYVDLCHCYN